MSFLDYLNQASATNSVRQIRKMIPENPNPLIEVSVLVSPAGIGTVEGHNLTRGSTVPRPCRRPLSLILRAQSLA